MLSAGQTVVLLAGKLRCTTPRPAGSFGGDIVNGSAAAWAFAQHVHPVSTKFVLVALACFASKDWLACLSASDIAEKTSLKRSVIFEALAQLKKLGLIQPTGNYKGLLPIYSVDPSTERTLPVHCVDPSTERTPTRPLSGRLLSSPSPGLLFLFSLPGRQSPPNPPQGGNGQLDLIEPKKAHKPKKNQYSQSFETFWAAYPDTNDSKYKTYEVWNRLKPPIEECLEAIPVSKRVRNGKMDLWNIRANGSGVDSGNSKNHEKANKKAYPRTDSNRVHRILERASAFRIL